MYFSPPYSCYTVRPSVRSTPAPYLTTVAIFIQQCRLRSHVQTLHDLHRLTTARTIIQPASLATIEWNAHAYGRKVWSPSRTSHLEQGRLRTRLLDRHSVVNLGASVLYMKPTKTTRVAALELVRTLVNKQLHKLNRKFRKLDLLPSSGRKVERHQTKGTVHWLHDAVRPVPTAAASQLAKKLPAFYGNKQFITALTTARHLFLSWARLIQSTHSHAIPSKHTYPQNPLTDSCAKLSPNNIQNCTSVYVHLYTELGPLYWATVSTCRYLQGHTHNRKHSPVPLAHTTT
jgi:hypothetical protein